MDGSSFNSNVTDPMLYMRQSPGESGTRAENVPWIFPGQSGRRLARIFWKISYPTVLLSSHPHVPPARRESWDCVRTALVDPIHRRSGWPSRHLPRALGKSISYHHCPNSICAKLNECHHKIIRKSQYKLDSYIEPYIKLWQCNRLSTIEQWIFFHRQVIDRDQDKLPLNWYIFHVMIFFWAMFCVARMFEQFVCFVALLLQRIFEPENVWMENGGQAFFWWMSLASWYLHL